jgi:NAD-dependent DNA ligase
MDAKKIATYSESELVGFLEKANEAYHNTGMPLVSDDLYDAMKNRLRQLNPKHPFLKKVGAPVRGDKVPLPYYLGSLDKIRDDPKHLTAFKKKYPGNYVVSDKLDGISALIVYEAGNEGGAKMYTRGDGVNGQDISRFIHLLSSIPKPGSGAAMAGMAIRGELILSRASWDVLSHKGANARNVVAGTVNAKHPDPEILKHVVFVAYELLSPKELPSEAFSHLKTLGFQVPYTLRLSDAEMDNEKLSEILVQRRKQSAFECDGIVVRHDAIHNYIKGKNPTYAFAYKSLLTHDEAEVILQSIEWNVSKDGFLKPTLMFEPVVLGGVKIQRATGFNGQFVEKHRLGAGARVVIIRSGDVIPHVVRVLSAAATGEPSMPDVPYEWTATHVDIKATGEASDAQALKQLEFFVKQMDIPYLGSGTLAKLYKAGVKTIPGVMHLTVDQLVKVEGIQVKGATKIVAGIEAVRHKATCLDYMNASNLFGRGVGRKKLEAVVAAYPEVLTGVVPKGELRPVEGIRPDNVQLILDALPAFYTLAKSIDKELCGKKTKTKKETETEADAALEPLRGKTIVFTGFREKEWEAQLKTVECTVSGTVSKKVTMVVAADVEETSAKLEKARALGIPIVSKAAFAKKFARI